MIDRHLFAAQVLSLLGNGLATVALGLLAIDVTRANSGAVLGTALAIKMEAYVGIARVAGALAHLVTRLSLLVALDLPRAAVALAIPSFKHVRFVPRSNPKWTGPFRPMAAPVLI